MRTVNVVAAIIRRGDRIFATQRGYGSYKDFWEFPGGKVEPNESPEQALQREIREELDKTLRRCFRFCRRGRTGLGGGNAAV